MVWLGIGGAIVALVLTLVAHTWLVQFGCALVGLKVPSFGKALLANLAWGAVGTAAGCAFTIPVGCATAWLPMPLAALFSLAITGTFGAFAYAYVLQADIGNALKLSAMSTALSGAIGLTLWLVSGIIW